MRIICGYVQGGLRPETEAALRRYAPDCELLDFTGNDYAYWEAVNERWGKGDDLVILEQDIELTAEVLPSFAECRRPWCTFEYESREGSDEYWRASLGCVRFTADLQAAVSFIPRRTWRDLDYFVQFHLWGHHLWGYRTMMDNPHVHGRVKHHHSPSVSKPLNLEELYDGAFAHKGPAPLSQGTCHCGKKYSSYLRGVTMCPKHQGAK